MNDERDDWETLNAYVDGELSPQEAARVARRAARDPQAAGRIAAMSALRAALRSSMEPPPELDLDGRSQPRAHAARAAAAAAVAALLLSALGVGVMLSDSAPRELAVAHDMHREWIEQNDPRPEAEAARTLRTSLEHLDVAAHVPDLSSVDLVFAHIRALPRERGRRGLHVGYLGNRGCMMSLVIVENAEATSSPMQEHRYDGRNGYVWQVGRYSYVLLADRMDPQRLMRVAAVVERMTRRAMQPGARERLALRESRIGARPCIV